MRLLLLTTRLTRSCFNPKVINGHWGFHRLCHQGSWQLLPQQHKLTSAFTAIPRVLVAWERTNPTTAIHNDVVKSDARCLAGEQTPIKRPKVLQFHSSLRDSHLPTEKDDEELAPPPPNILFPPAGAPPAIQSLRFRELALVRLSLLSPARKITL